MSTTVRAWLIALGLLAGLGLAGSAEAVPPPQRYEYEVVPAKKVEKNVVKILKVDPDFCISYFQEKPRSRFIRKTSKSLARVNGWAPRSSVAKGVRKGFKEVCVT